jgi:hypothetical protein
VNQVVFYLDINGDYGGGVEKAACCCDVESTNESGRLTNAEILLLMPAPQPSLEEILVNIIS